jgi:hypothetical protein
MNTNNLPNRTAGVGKHLLVVLLQKLKGREYVRISLSLRDEAEIRAEKPILAQCLEELFKVLKKPKRLRTQFLR